MADLVPHPLESAGAGPIQSVTIEGFSQFAQYSAAGLPQLTVLIGQMALANLR